MLDAKMTTEYEISFYTDEELIDELKRRHTDIIVIMEDIRDPNKLKIMGATNPKCGLGNVPGGGVVVALNMLYTARQQIIYDVQNGNI